MKFKGKTIIELFDAKTGRLTQRTEDRNMATNFITAFYEQGGITNPSAFGAANVRNDALRYLLGGLLALDTALTEDADNLRIPAGVAMTANGGVGIVNTGNPAELGSYNELESGWNQDGSYKMVYNWNQSQGNGTIASVALTSLYNGIQGIGNHSGTSRENTLNMGHYNAITSRTGPDLSNKIFAYKGNRLLALDIFNRTDWLITEYGYPLTKIDVRDSLNLREVRTRNIQIPAEIQNLANNYDDANHNRRIWHQDGDILTIMLGRVTYNYYNYRATYYFSNDYPIFIIKYNVQTDAVQVITLSPATTGLDPFEREAAPTFGVNSTEAVLDNYIIDLTNPVNVKEIQDIGQGRNLDSSMPGVFRDSGIYVDTTNLTAYPVNNSTANNYQADRYLGLLGQNSSYVFRDPRYLATINNLETPVIKTADKMMKITYVIRFLEEA